MASPHRPKLEVVDGGADEAGAGSASRSRERPILPMVIGALLLAALLGLALQTQRVGELETRVQGLRTELTAAHGALDAHRTHLDAVRGSVADLQAQIGALGELVTRDPAPPEASPSP